MPKCSQSRDLIAIAICDSNREYQSCSNWRQWAGWVRPPPRGARRKPLLACFRVGGGLCDICAPCLRCLYGMLYVCPCLVLLSRLCCWSIEWAKSRNNLLGHKRVSRWLLVFASRGRFPERGAHWALGALVPWVGFPEEKGRPMGPATPLVHTTKFFLPPLRTLIWFWECHGSNVWFFSWLGMEMTQRSSVAL